MDLTIFLRTGTTKKLQYVLPAGILPLLTCSICFAPNNSYYFKNLTRDTAIDITINRNTESVIRRDDQLAINISILNPPESLVYNAVTIRASAASTGTSA